MNIFVSWKLVKGKKLLHYLVTSKPFIFSLKNFRFLEKIDHIYSKICVNTIACKYCRFLLSLETLRPQMFCVSCKVRSSMCFTGWAICFHH